MRIINDIIYAMPTSLVTIFKEYLYFDDPTEYLRRIYTDFESFQRLPRLINYQLIKLADDNGYDKLMPTIRGTAERRIMAKNLKKKRKLWLERLQELDKRHFMQDIGMGDEGSENSIIE